MGPAERLITKRKGLEINRRRMKQIEARGCISGLYRKKAVNLWVYSGGGGAAEKNPGRLTVV